jgi:hypothetical protein
MPPTINPSAKITNSIFQDVHEKTFMSLKILGEEEKNRVFFILRLFFYTSA